MQTAKSMISKICILNLTHKGIDRLCRDTEFMIGRNPGWYWRTCWGILTPLMMVFILLYTLISYKPLTYKGEYYPSTAYGKHYHHSTQFKWFHFQFEATL